MKQCHQYPGKGFSLIDPESFSNYPTKYEKLGPGMIHLKNYVSIKDQVDLVNICEKWGVEHGGFYEPSRKNGAKVPLQRMCFGRWWTPETKYREGCRGDGYKPPPLPNEVISLAKTAIQDAQQHLEDLPPMYWPDVCLVNFYSAIYDKLDFHQDRDERFEILYRGLPVVSISIGDSAEFFYGATSAKKKSSSILLQSGDVLIFGGKSRLIYHGVKQTFQSTAPLPFVEETGFTEGRLNLTIKQS